MLMMSSAAASAADDNKSMINYPACKMLKSTLSSAAILNDQGFEIGRYNCNVFILN